MADEQWTRQQFEELATIHMQNAQADPSNFMQHLKSFFGACTAHFDNATEDGKAFVEERVQRMGGLFEHILKQAPDGVENRKSLRMLSAVQNKHYQAKDLFEAFAERPITSDVWIDEAVEVLIRTVQSLMDILHDATRGSHRGAAQFAIRGLFYWLIDEITAAQFLARQSHATLAYSHLRATMEIIDKVQLFTEKPAEADLWVSGDEHEIWKKLSPPRVREKLGKSNFDPIYRYFSEQGSHSTFTAMQARVRKTPNGAGQGISVALMIGGIEDRPRQVSILLYAILLANVAIARAAIAFSDTLNTEEVVQTVVASSDDLFSFSGKLFTSPEWRNGDKRPFEELRAAWQTMRDDVIREAASHNSRPKADPDPPDSDE
jgi:hypothetical protein